MNMDYKVFTNVCTALCTLCIVVFSSWFLSWSPMAMITIYWKDFGLCLMAWSVILFVLYFVFRRSSIALYFLSIAAFLLLAGLCIFLFAPKQSSPELGFTAMRCMAHGYLFAGSPYQLLAA
ncbi:hypothetical protein [Taibaiella chishuiensis]|uniref:Uncharacterized protein n=1 Tax=Taibaiella chishuiensis TaxID=1434707 RepID=A0A2P8CZG5_9BACT|nr:hypothetical protein [Taibaiella chishuiensis]PSK90354.1 hypothetical protein B0I18_10884 [Taibaiella chishuiensis]